MNIGVFFGSRSPEHDISIITGELIISELKKLGHNIVPVYVGKDGQWYVGEQLGFLKFFLDGKPDFKDSKKVYLDLEKSKGKMVFVKKGLARKEYLVDLAFPAFHGAYGEDGAIQGLFEMFNIPYIGCGVTASAIAIDKVLTKLFFKVHSIPTADFVNFDFAEWQKNKESIIQKCNEFLGWPAVVKPTKLGSSIGIVKANNNKEMEQAIEVAFQYGPEVFVEKAVLNLMDLTCVVLGNEEPKTSFVQRAVFRDEIFSYQDKYLEDGGAQLGNAVSNLIIPADIPDTIGHEIMEMSIKIFKLLGCSGIARVDFLYDSISKKYFATEINPLPGTLYHHLWKASGLEIDELLKILIQLAQDKHAKQNTFVQSFHSDILKHANSVKLNIKDEQVN